MRRGTAGGREPQNEGKSAGPAASPGTYPVHSPICSVSLPLRRGAARGGGDFRTGRRLPRYCVHSPICSVSLLLRRGAAGGGGDLRTRGKAPASPPPQVTVPETSKRFRKFVAIVLAVDAVPLTKAVKEFGRNFDCR